MGKYGKKVVVNNDMSRFIVGVVAPSGWGKSTLMYETCEKLYGSEGYICADFGTEDGYAAIAGAVVEKCPNWKHFKNMVDDIVKNKDTDYPNLKVIIWDTLDAAFECAEEYAITCFNQEHLGEQNFRPAVSINSVDGGFGKGMDRTIAYVKKEINRLKSVGVGTFFTAHCKERDQTDLFTGNTFTQLTSSLTNRYFGAIKDISHIIGFGYYSREMQQVEVGKENIVTKKKKTRDEVIKEDRKIRFRDNDYLCDAKSRFANIEPEINLDPDEFINAIQGAINSASGDETNATPSEPEPEVEEEIKMEEQTQPVEMELDLEDEPEIDLEVLCKDIREKYSAASDDTKKQVKAVLEANNTKRLSANLGEDVLREIADIVGL